MLCVVLPGVAGLLFFCSKMRGRVREWEREREREREAMSDFCHSSCNLQWSAWYLFGPSYFFSPVERKWKNRGPLTNLRTYLRWMCMPKQKFELWNVSIKNISIYLLCVRCNVLAWLLWLTYGGYSISQSVTFWGSELTTFWMRSNSCLWSKFKR